MTQYLYGNPGNPFQITASRSTDNTLTTYSYDTSGNLFAFERAGSRYYVATDHLGTPKVVTYDNGTIVKQAEYDAWGVKLSDSAPTFELPVGFAGGIPEALTGQVRFGFRDYEPGTGRWVARDPILFEGGQGNLYGYVSNSPINWRDPQGLRPLNDYEKTTLSPYIPNVDLNNADLHVGDVPWYLPGSMIGITRGNDIYLRSYDPSSINDIATLGHELVHVGQYRDGVTALGFLWSYRYGYSRNTKYEKPAYEMGDTITFDLNRMGNPCDR